MAKIKTDLTKVLGCVLLVICTKTIHIKSDSDFLSSYNFKFVNFEQFKIDLFTNNFNISNDAKCLTELNAIKKGFLNSEQWAHQSKLYCGHSTLFRKISSRTKM